MIKKLTQLEFSKGKKDAINIAASVINLLVTTLISFVLSPYIVSTIGKEANGFITLANSFVTYATLVRTALNSMGSRFIMMAYYNDEHKKVNRYYSSLLYADIVLGAVFGVLGGLCVWKLEVILNVPVNIVSDVKLLFALIFLNFVISTMLTVWNTIPYIKNKLYLDSISNALHSIARALVIAGMFMCLSPAVYFVGLGTLIGGLVTVFFSYFYKKYLMPQLKASRKDFSWKTIWELISSGVWNAISSLGTTLLSGLDLLVANLFIGATTMGDLALAKTMPTFVSTLNDTIANVFTPSLIIDYAKGKIDNIVKTIRQSSKIISVICSLPLGFLIVYGEEFYSLWQPTENAQILHILSVITIFGRVFFTGMQPLFNVFTVVNKVRINSVITIITGATSIGLTFILLKTLPLEYGVYIIAGVSVACCFIKNMVFVIPYSAKYLGLKWTTFFSTVVPSVLCFVILFAWGMLEKLLLPGNNGWLSLILAGVVFCAVGVVLTITIVLNKNEKKHLFSIIKNKVRR